MTIEFRIQEADLLASSLYTATTSGTLGKKDRKNGILFGLFALFFCWVTYSNHSPVTAFALALIALYFLFVYPWHMKNYNFKHYRDFIRRNFYRRFNALATIAIHPEYIFTTDVTCESKIFRSEFDLLIETKDYFFFRMRTGGQLILPKRALEEPGRFCAQVNEIWAEQPISCFQDLKWSR